jgi:hypothetical protein
LLQSSVLYSQIVQRKQRVMNNNDHSGEYGLVFNDEASTASSSVFDELVDEVLDGEASIPSSLAAVARSELQDLLLVDPEAIRRPVTSMPGEIYKYPLNLAIHYNATADVIRLLLEADPTVTTLPDGDENQGSLHILLSHRQRDLPDILPLVDSFLLAHPTCTQIRDSHGCVPLHTAVYHQAKLDIIRHLVIIYPEALRIQNEHQETPVALATQLGAVSLTCNVANFMLESLLAMEN